MTINFKNLYQKYSLDKNFITRVDKIFSALLEQYALGKGEITLVFADNPYLQRLNREYRGKNAPTDVLSFSYLEENNRVNSKEDEFPIGDIYISIDLAEQQANEAGHSLEFEMARLAIHGLLHLIGYDHDRPEKAQEMQGNEEILLASYWWD